MDNMKPLLDAVTDNVDETRAAGNINKATATGDINKATTTGDKAGSQNCRDATKAGQRESSCGRRDPTDHRGGPAWDGRADQQRDSRSDTHVDHR